MSKLDNIRDLWPEIDQVPQDLNHPYSMLEALADTLPERTWGILGGTVTCRQKPEVPWQEVVLKAMTKEGGMSANLETTLYITAPRVNEDYRYELLWLAHGPEGYPAYLHFEDDPSVTCVDADALLKELKRVLSSDRTRSILQGLMTMSRKSPDLPF